MKIKINNIPMLANSCKKNVREIKLSKNAKKNGQIPRMQPS